jgi:sterol-4alpha-carboxylate 3-dehydrogenase (decarboxylating)
MLWHTNVHGTNVLLQQATECPTVRALIYTSTDSAIHPPKPGEVLTEENAQLYDKNSKIYTYAKTKAIADAAVLAANSSELKTAVIRIPGIYGENDDNGIGSLLKNLRKGQQRIQAGENKKRFEFCFVGKAAKAHVLAAKALLAGPEAGRGKVDGEAFFISDGVRLPFFDFARKVYAFAGHPVAENEIRVVPLWFMWALAMVSEWLHWVFTFGTMQPDVRSVGVEYLDRGCEWKIDKARERLGYWPVEDQDEVLRRVVEFEVKRLKM